MFKNIQEGKLATIGILILVATPVISILLRYMSHTLPGLGSYTQLVAVSVLGVSIVLLVTAGIVRLTRRRGSAKSSSKEPVLSRVKAHLTQNKLAAIGGMWVLLIPVTIYLVSSILSVLDASHYAYQGSIHLVLSVGGVLMGLAYYQRFPKLEVYRRVALGVAVAVVYYVFSYYYLVAVGMGSHLLGINFL